MMTTKILILALLALVSAGTYGGEVGAEPAAAAAVEQFGVTLLDSLPVTPSLREYSGFALAHNRNLAAARATWEAASVRGDIVGALPDPRFTWSEAIEPVETRVGPQQRVLALTQQIPWFGTLGLRREVEETRAWAAQAQTQAVALAVLDEVRTAYHELAYLERGIETLQDHLQLLVQWEKSARSRYETGVGSFAHVVKAQVEIGVLEDRLAALRERRRPLTARLNAALGRASAAPVHVESVYREPVALDVAGLQQLMLTTNPELAVLDNRAAGYLRAGDLARKSGYPGLSLGFSYIQIGPARMDGVDDSGKDAMFATVGLSLPLWRGSYDAAEREADSRFRATESLRSDLARRFATSMEQAIYQYNDAGRRSVLYRDTLLPKARQSIGAVLSAYETGDADFLDLVDAERVLLEFELAAHRSAADLLIGLADIDRLVGGRVYTTAVLSPAYRED